LYWLANAEPRDMIDGEVMGLERTRLQWAGTGAHDPNNRRPVMLIDRGGWPPSRERRPQEWDVVMVAL